MPDDDERAADRHLGPLVAASSGLAELQPVEFRPYVEYRGVVLWHHLSDAHDLATRAATLRGYRHLVRPRRVPGHDHVLWLVRPIGGRR